MKKTAKLTAALPSQQKQRKQENNKKLSEILTGIPQVERWGDAKRIKSNRAGKYTGKSKWILLKNNSNNALHGLKYTQNQNTQQQHRWEGVNRIKKA